MDRRTILLNLSLQLKEAVSQKGPSPLALIRNRKEGRKMHYADIKKADIANGQGVRVSVGTLTMGKNLQKKR